MVALSSRLVGQSHGEWRGASSLRHWNSDGMLSEAGGMDGELDKSRVTACVGRREKEDSDFRVIVLFYETYIILYIVCTLLP